MEKSKILFILHIPPPVHGSSMVGSYIKQSQKIKQNFNCRFINLGTSFTINEIGKKPFLKAFRYIKIIFLILKELFFNKPDLCYLAITAKGKAFYKDSFIVFLIKFFGVSIVFHFHNKGVRTRNKKLFDNFLYEKVFKNTHAILLSKFLYPDIKKYFSFDRVHFCPNGIPKMADFDKFKEKNREKNGETKILFLSNLIETKGVKILLEACRILKEKGTHFKCVFVGGEGDISKKDLERITNEYNIEDCAIYKGKKYNEDKANEFYSSDIFVLPTFYPYECFPLVLLEAMQASLPIVSTDEGGISDIVVDNITGLLVPQKNVHELVNKLEFLIKNSKIRNKMGQAGKEKYEKELTLEHFERNLTNILNNVIRIK